MFDRGRGEESVDDWRSLPGPALDVARDHAPAENDGVIDREQPVTETVRERIARGHITGAIRVIGFSIVNALIKFRERQHAQEHRSETRGVGKEWVRKCR